MTWAPLQVVARSPEWFLTPAPVLLPQTCTHPIDGRTQTFTTGWCTLRHAAEKLVGQPRDGPLTRRSRSHRRRLPMTVIVRPS